MITQSTQKKLALLIIASLVLTILIAIASVRTTQKANVWITGQLKVEKYGDTYAIKGSVYNAGERTAYDVKITIKTIGNYPETISNIGNLAPKETRDFYGSYTSWFSNETEYYVWSNVKVEWINK